MAGTTLGLGCHQMWLLAPHPGEVGSDIPACERWWLSGDHVGLGVQTLVATQPGCCYIDASGRWGAKSESNPPRGARGAGLGCHPHPPPPPRRRPLCCSRLPRPRGWGDEGGGHPVPPAPPAPWGGGLSATAGPRAWTPPGRPPARPQPGSAAFPAAGSASSLGHGSRPLVQLSKQGVSLSFWLTKSQRGTGGLNACVWTQAIIPNYSLSFEPARPAGELAAERAP